MNTQQNSTAQNPTPAAPSDALKHTAWPIITNDEKQAVLAVLERGILSGSFAPEAVALEREFAAYVGAKYALLTHSGTSALQVAVTAAGADFGDEVIVPAYSFVATPMSVALQGATPVFADVRVEDGTIDPALVDAAITPRTRAIMPVHVHGAPADLDDLFAVVAKHNAKRSKDREIRIVEDAAQAHGATWNGKKVGAIGHGGGFSLQSSKNLCGGEGGLYVTNDEEAWHHANRVRNFGQDLNDEDRKAYDPKMPLDGHRGLNSLAMGSMYRGNEMMAAFVRVQLRRLPELTERAQGNAAWLVNALKDLPGVIPPPSRPNAMSVHHKFRVRFDLAAAGVAQTDAVAFRSALLQALRVAGLDAVMWQGAPLPAQKIFRDVGTRPPFVSLEGGTDLRVNYDPSKYPVTRELLDSSIVLFSHTRPLIAQSRSTVEGYAKAFTKVWNARRDLRA